MNNQFSKKHCENYDQFDCLECKISFLRTHKNRKFCSKKCQHENRIKNEEYKTNHEKSCPQCNKKFIISNKNQKFCSHSCSMSYRQKDGPWNTGLHETEEHRKNISIGLHKSSKKLIGNKNPSTRPEVRGKISKTMKERRSMAGKNNPNWRGGINSEVSKIRNGDEYKKWRTNVFERDQYICQLCNKNNNTLNAHHIKTFSKYPELRLIVSNGITLCCKCHDKIKRKESFFEFIFYSILICNKFRRN
jgi:hypothetical protein